MPDLAIDTSSYPKPTNTSFLDQARGYQQLESNKLTIDKQKLDLLNQRFGEMAKGFTALINQPDLTEDNVRNYVTNQVKLGYVTPEMATTTISQLPPTQGMDAATARVALKQHLETQLAHAQTIAEAINFHYGQPQGLDTGNAVQPVVTSPKFGIQSTGLPIAKQLPTGTQGYDQNGNPVFAPPNPNAVAAPPMRTPLPIERPTAAPAPSSTFAQRFAPQPPPLFAEGKQAYTEDQAQALGRATAMKPAEQALKLLPGLRSGPGTEPFNKAVAFLKANGIISTEENDPTAIYQEVNKKLAQYVASSPAGQRSDAAQTLAEAASPSPKTQINQALVKLTRDALALDRVQIARPNAFEGQDYQNYGKHRATFPQSVDERAFGLMDLDKGEREKLVDRMHNLYKKNPNNPEAVKFFKSMDIAKKQGFLNPQTTEE